MEKPLSKQSLEGVLKKALLTNFVKFTRKHLRCSLSLERDSSAGVFQIFQSFLIKQMRTAASAQYTRTTLIYEMTFCQCSSVSIFAFVFVFTNTEDSWNIRFTKFDKFNFAISSIKYCILQKFILQWFRFELYCCCRRVVLSVFDHFVGLALKRLIH